MATQQRPGYINEVAMDEIVGELNLMESSSTYITKPTFRGDSAKWPGNQISFVNFHLEYLKSHPTLNPYHYLANLRLMLRKKRT
ncbi:MAG TPA: hypothetical protein VFB03_04045 [Candidatus Saccharimonadales bacterium]|nr:hypothetical protein [Candidatus Saccharimonadales bacterium]